jgi:serine-protein kinase ATM
MAGNREVSGTLPPFSNVSNFVLSFDHISLTLAGREALFSSIKKQPYLAELMRLNVVDTRVFEVNCVRHSLKLARSHSSLQSALNRATYLSHLVKQNQVLGLEIGEVVSRELAGVLWDHGDMMSSIQMLKQLKANPETGKQAIPVSRPGLLADLV